jgi:hypothetical protein
MSSSSAAGPLDSFVLELRDSVVKKFWYWIMPQY